ncbi:hypothetical protein FOCC_FOCC015630 [Frankliniella occidentalis]|nr:hypothetical protein FOCC_FOCC015630 [Frankliniella occidentalis]
MKCILLTFHLHVPSPVAAADSGTARETTPTDRPTNAPCPLHEGKQEAEDGKTLLHEELILDDDGPEGADSSMPRGPTPAHRPPRPTDPLHRAYQVAADEKITQHQRVTVAEGPESSGSSENGQLVVTRSYSLRTRLSYAIRDGGEGGLRDDDDLELHPESNGEDDVALEQHPEDGGQEAASEAEAAEDNSAVSADSLDSSLRNKKWAKVQPLEQLEPRQKSQILCNDKAMLCSSKANALQPQSISLSANPGTARETAPTDRPPQLTGPLHEVKVEAVDEKTSLHEELNLDDDGPEGSDSGTSSGPTPADRPLRHNDPLHRTDRVDEKVELHHAVTVADGPESSGSGEDGQLLVTGSYSLRTRLSNANRDGGKGEHQDDEDLAADPGTARETAPTDRPPHPTGPLHEVKLDAVDEKTSLHEELNLNDDGPEGADSGIPSGPTPADRPPRPTDPLHRANEVAADQKITLHHAVTVADGTESSGSVEDGQLLEAESYSLRTRLSKASRDGGKGEHQDDEDLEQHPESNRQDGEALQQHPEDPLGTHFSGQDEEL